jgi:hypothetical protein
VYDELTDRYRRVARLFGDIPRSDEVFSGFISEHFITKLFIL